MFILADDLGWKDVGLAGAEFFETPHIDTLSAQGMTFSAGHSGGPDCAPPRTCLMSGTYTPRHRICTPGGQSKGQYSVHAAAGTGKEPQRQAPAETGRMSVPDQ